MKILLIGQGGREHSLAIKISQSPNLTKLYIAPGNPGTAQLGENIHIAQDNIPELLNFAKTNQIDITIVGPEIPLAMGIADQFQAAGLALIGPTKIATQLESSKAWAKDFLKKYGIPSAEHQTFKDEKSALQYITQKNTYPIVLKADGLAQGKGVTVAYNNAQAQDALNDCFAKKIFGKAGNKIVIEDFLEGEEASILAFTDGKTVLPMIAAQDHKTIYDNDKGPNTGGMGAYAPAPIVTPDVLQKTTDTIFKPLIKGFQREGILYQGILYAGLMIHQGIPKVVEFNVRFGDPETQVVLPLLENDILEIFQAMATKQLHTIQLKWKSQSAVCVVLASIGYPGKYETGIPISIAPALTNQPDLQIIHAGTKLNPSSEIQTNGGRVLGVVSTAQTLPTAIQKAYSATAQIHFKTKYHRTDIGKKALN